MYTKKDIIEMNWDYVVEQYSNPNVTQVEIAKAIGVNPSTLTRYAKSKGLFKTVKVKMTSENKEWLRENYQLPYKELREHTGCCDEVIRLALKDMGIDRNTPYRPFKIDMSDKEFLKDLEDPRLTAPDIVEKYKDKYGVGESRIHQLRKQLRIRLQVDSIHRESSAEKWVREILEELDVAYIQEKVIGRYHIDFYLGFKLCIEVQGHYWHNRPERKATDSRKRKFLSDKGYRVVYIWDNELDTAKTTIIKALQEQGLPVQ